MRAIHRYRGLRGKRGSRLGRVAFVVSLALVISQSFGMIAANAFGPQTIGAWGSGTLSTSKSTTGAKTTTTAKSTAGATRQQAGSTIQPKQAVRSAGSTAPLAANSLSVDLDQYANGGNTQPASWVNGDLNQHNAAYHEGDVVPFRAAIEGLTAGSHSIHINYDFTAGGHEAYDFLATWNASQSPGLCDSGGGGVSSMCPSLGSADSKAFPSDSFAPGSPTHSGLTVSGAEAFSSVTRSLTMYGGTITSISGPVHSGSVGGNSTGDFTVTFSSSGSAVLFAWGGHLAESAYWVTTSDAPNGAATISGAPWHMRTQQLDDSGNKNQDRSIQPSAIVPLPGLTIVKTADSSTVPAGDPIGFTITVTNTGNVGLSNVSLTDPLPGGAGIDWSIEGTPTGSPDCSISGSPPNETLNCTKDPLAKDSSFSVHVTSPTSDSACLKYDNTATVSADNIPDTSSSDSVTLTGCAPSLGITKTASSGSVNTNTAFTYTVTVSNTGNDQATGVTITDTLDASLTSLSAGFDIDPNTVGGTGDCDFSGSTMTCPGSGEGTITLAPSDGNTTGAEPDVVVVTIHATTSTTCRELSNTAHVTWDGNENGVTSYPATVVNVIGCAPSLSITKEGPASVGQGGTITYTVTVHNSGNAAANGVVVTDNLVDSLTDVSGTFGAQVSCSVGTNPNNQSDVNYVTCSLGTVGAGETVVITITAKAPVGVCPTITNQATLTASGQELAINSNIVPTTVTGCGGGGGGPTPAGIQVVKDGPAVAHVGDTITYTFAVSLAPGSATLTNITLVDPICIATPTLESKTGGDQDTALETGETWNYSCKHLVTATDRDPLPNTVTVTGTGPNGQVSDTDTHSVDIIHPAIRIVKTANPGSIGPGETVTYTYKVTNTGDVTLFDVKVTDNKLGNICTIAQLDVGETKTCTADFTASSDFGGPVDNVGKARGHDVTGVSVQDTDQESIDVVLGTTVTPVTPPSSLAFTGSSGVLQMAGVALLLLLLGTGILFFTRRREDGTEA